MSGYVLKPADHDLTFALDWRQGYLSPGERIIENSGCAVTPARNAAETLLSVAQGHDGFCSWVVFAGGAPGCVYLVTIRVSTDLERVLHRAIVVRIATA